MSNSISFVGKLGKDSERIGYAGGQLLKFSVANNVGWGDKKQTVWWNCAIFGKQAEGALMDYLVKGAQVYITGEVSFTEGKDGKTYNNVTVNNIELVGSKSDGQSQAPKQQSQGYGQQPQNSGYAQQAQTPNNDLRDDLPF